MPTRLLFHDTHGSVLLIGCRARGYRANLFGPGSGVIHADYAVLGVGSDIDFGLPTGMRTEISGLREWLGVSSIKEQNFFKQTPNKMIIEVESADSIEITIGLTLEPSWRRDWKPSRDELVVKEVLYCESGGEFGGDWRSQIRPHLALRDLLMLSSWRKEHCAVKFLLREDDVIETADGTNHGAYWREVLHKEAVAPASRGAGVDHLIRFNDIGVAGLREWLPLRETFARALDPIVSSRILENLSTSALLAQVGPALEALGYLLLLEDGKSESLAGRATLKEKLDRISSDISEISPFDTVQWSERTAIVYNSLKHANRAMPDELEVANRWQESILAVRLWVALRLGVDAAELRSRAARDSQTTPFVRISR